MCGIVAVLRRPARRPTPDPLRLEESLAGALVALGDEPPADHLAYERAAALVEGVDRQLRGSPGVQAILDLPSLAGSIEGHLGQVRQRIEKAEAALDTARPGSSPAVVEQINAALLRLKDATWAVAVDRLGAARSVADLAGPAAGRASVDANLSLHVALAALGRLEVRGRDSAGIHILVEGHGLDLESPEMRQRLGARLADPLFTSLAVRAPQGCLSVVYKVAAEIGELGDNVAALRSAIAGDELLREALRSPSARAMVMGHTRWASVGIVSAPNAHPLDGYEVGGGTPGGPAPYVVSALNGDVDNYAQLCDRWGLALPPEITTDAKVIPVLVSRGMARGLTPDEAFREAVATFDGSVAIAAQAAADPSRLLLAQRGSGQGLYVGLAEDAFVVASEPYGLVEETSDFVRVDGDAGGRVVVLDAAGAGTIEGIDCRSYDGRRISLGPEQVQKAEITTRDIDRRGYPHFLLKEISEAPQSVRKTLRGKVLDRDGRLSVTIGDQALPPAMRRMLAEGAFRRVIAVGQGTAAVAAQAVAASVARALADQPIMVSSLPATELSGFGPAGRGLDDDLSDVLAIAVSQSGSTTDTNRTVDLIRSRGAQVIAIVNRRNSDLTSRADGVLYTSDGRDVEMSVASTKAFYAQVAAGELLALALADAAGCADPAAAHALLDGLQRLPDAMDRVLSDTEAIVVAAHQEAPGRRYWAVVGSGPNRIAAAEVRIKLSELCYKSIACDTTEDKKHIDLSSEPLILVCAGGLTGPNADDVAKEVAIYRAHRAAPVVIADAGEGRFGAALHTLAVPPTHPDLSFVLSAMVGHLFGYHAALAVDAGARPLREARAAIETAAAAPRDPIGNGLLDRAAQGLAAPSRAFAAAMRAGRYDGNLEASTAVRLASLLGYATGGLPLDGYEAEYGQAASPARVLDSLADALTRAIDELTRPIDAIKHQAKTVTVGISRSEDAVLAVPLVATVLSLGPRREQLSYRVVRTLAALDAAVISVDGFTRYRVEGDVSDKATIHVIDQGGIASDLPPSRTAADPTLRGTKRGALDEGEVTVAVGRSDGRTVVLVPETEARRPTGLTLLHVTFHDRLTAEVAHRVLAGYRQRRFEALVDAVTETEREFREDKLAEVAVVDLLVTPVLDLAERWRP